MNPFRSDTIAAVATALPSGISIIRISGGESLGICDKIFSCKGKPPSERKTHTIVFGHLTDLSGVPVDQALLLIMRGPRSYTGEDTAELQGHGGPAVTGRALQICLDAGCRLAEPGEFTRRAFLNGRMDLLQAEAVQDLVRAETDLAARAAAEQLEGALSGKINRIYTRLLDTLSGAEAALDFEDTEMPPVRWNRMRSALEESERECAELLSGWREGRILREGIRVVIQGPPNVGKSSLFNRLVGSHRAIVSVRPGTTRDVIEESVHMDGLLFRFVDTAGLRESECDIEQEGVRRSLKSAENADLILHVEDMNSIRGLNRPDLPADLEACRVLPILNKSDLEGFVEAHAPGQIRVSAKTGDGMKELRRALCERALCGKRLMRMPHAVISERHRELLKKAKDRIEEARSLMNAENEADLVPISTELREGLQRLGELTGKNYCDDLLDRIFSTFCIGK